MHSLYGHNLLWKRGKKKPLSFWEKFLFIFVQWFRWSSEYILLRYCEKQSSRDHYLDINLPNANNHANANIFKSVMKMSVHKFKQKHSVYTSKRPVKPYMVRKFSKGSSWRRERYHYESRSLQVVAKTDRLEKCSLRSCTVAVNTLSLGHWCLIDFVTPFGCLIVLCQFESLERGNVACAEGNSDVSQVCNHLEFTWCFWVIEMAS